MTAARGARRRALDTPCAWPARAAFAALALLAMGVARDGARAHPGEPLLAWSVAPAAVPSAWPAPPAGAAGAGEDMVAMLALPAPARVEPAAPEDALGVPAPPGDLLAALPHAIDEAVPQPDDAPRAAPEPVAAPERLPAALVDAAPGEARKRLFLEAMTPALVAENERLLERRGRLLALFDAIDAGSSPAQSELDWLAETAERYAADQADRAGLLARVDAIPLSLGLSQAALESGWGASRGAQEWHGIFGQMSFAADPARPVLRRFDSIQEAVAAWAHSLNAHRAYSRFRAMRAKAREEGRAPDGHALAGALLRYSERGEAYVRELRALIRANGFEALDRLDARG
mgnify:CR=1 FL=1